MVRTTDDDRRRSLRAAAREYRKKGYDVIEHPAGEQLPPFLQGFSPGLLALHGDDRVVIEAKSREELKGSNEFVALATAVGQHEGWRLELIHLASRRPAAVGADRAKLDVLAARSRAAQEAGLQDAALIYALSVLEELIREIGAQHGIKVLRLSARAIVRELAFLGIVGGEAVEVLDRAWAERERIMSGAAGAVHADADAVGTLITACRDVQEAMRLEAA